MSILELHDVSLGFEMSTITLAGGITARFPRGWTGVVGPNGSGKTTLLKVVTGALPPLRGQVIAPDRAVYCDQRDDEPPVGLAEFMVSDDARARRLRARLGLRPDWGRRWSSLSHGERRRAQIAVALYCDPDLLALDEPTNHVDAATRDRLLTELSGFRGIGFVVSHDRALLDELCGQCAFFEADGRVVLRSGGYSSGAEVADAEHDAAVRARDRARRERKKLLEVAADRRREAARADQRRSGRKAGRRDHDARAKRHAARVTGKDALAGRALNQIKGRVRQAGARLDDRHVTDRRDLGLTMRGAPARKDTILRLPDGVLPLGPERVLAVPELVVGREDRIGVAGVNGAGKSTLMRHVLDHVALPLERVVTLSQEIEPEYAAEIVRSLHELPSTQRGDVLAAVACLGSAPEQVLESETLSPGELRKLLLAMGLSREPHLIVMDEPTNHLDLPSIECLERALAACRCALLLVSHDAPFLERLTTRRWTVHDGALQVE